jgi:hypothetical protein
MSSATTPDIGTALVNAISNAIQALANVMGGVASALSQYSTDIGTVIVVGGLAVLAWRTMDRAVPFIRGMFGRLF